MVKLTQRAKMFGDMAQGGYFQAYEIYDGEKPIGTKTVSAPTRHDPAMVVYRLGDQTFRDLKDFVAAYEAQR